mmetsp:Transcript_19548/g.22745  ORF Transcript_19548/g.22745 Transcript_19548/m.22745 type:complete len:85 (+) Transcript_19548:42-296(+)
MGSISSIHGHSSESWSKADGCEHFSKDTHVKEIKWKVVPISGAEAAVVFRRLMKMTGRLTIEATSGLDKKNLESNQEVIQCKYY